MSFLRGHVVNTSWNSFIMKNVTLTTEDPEPNWGMHDLIYVEMDLLLHVIDKLVLILTGLAAFANIAVFVTLNKLPSAKNYSPVRMLQILAILQTIWGTLHGVEDPRLRTLNGMVPEMVPRTIACKVSQLVRNICSWHFGILTLLSQLLILISYFFLLLFSEYLVYIYHEKWNSEAVFRLSSTILSKLAK